jgi:hypothetical protein
MAGAERCRRRVVGDDAASILSEDRDDVAQQRGYDAFEKARPCMTRFLLTGLSLGLVLGLALPAAIDPASAVTRARIKVHPSRHWYGYGFLPG